MRLKSIWLSVIVVCALASEAFSSSLEACYNAFYIFRVGETCITYRLAADDRLEVESFARTTGLVDSVRRFEERSQSVLAIHPLKPLVYTQQQSNRRGTRVHDYTFHDEGIDYAIVRYHSDGRVRSNNVGTFEESGFHDPYSLSLSLQLTRQERGELPLFFGGEAGSVEFRYRGRDTIEAAGQTFRTRRLDITPKAEDEDGALSPQGSWRFWIDEKTGLLVRMRISVAVGSATVTISSLKGDMDLLQRIILPE